MADIKISQMSNAAALDGSELVPLVQSGGNVKATTSVLQDFIVDATAVDAAGAVMNSDTSTAAMSFVVDEDTMVSDSDTKVPTQQSVKAYVDAVPTGINTGKAIAMAIVFGG